MTDSYSLIPDFIFSSSDLTCLQKLLYAKISSLAQQRGYCWATSAHLGELLGMHRVTISKAINDMVEKGYMRLEMKDRYHRKIYLLKTQCVTSASHIKDKCVASTLHIVDKSSECVASTLHISKNVKRRDYRGVALTHPMCSANATYNNISNNKKNIGLKNKKGVDNSPSRKSSKMEEAFNTIFDLLHSKRMINATT